MIKFIKWLFISALSLLGLAVTAVLIVVFVSNNEIVLSEPTNLTVDITLGSHEYGFYINGNTNLPDNTMLAIDFVVDGDVKGQTSTMVEHGKFAFVFSEKLINFDQIEIKCYKNKHHQEESVLKQLAFVNDFKDQECIANKFLIKDLKQKYFSQLLNYQTPNNLNDSDVEIRSVNDAQIKRTVINLYANKAINNEELNKHIKYWILKEIVKESKTKAIVVKCFHKGDNITFRTNAVFAPYGEWARANENVGFSEYKLKI